MTKTEFRKLFLEKRRALSPSEIVDKSRFVADRFFEYFDLSRIHNLHCFVSIAKFNEIDTSLIYKRIWSDFPATRTYIPRVERGTGELVSHMFGLGDQLVENSWGIHEPSDDEAIEPSVFDTVLVPLLCIDVRGHRVGYGKGFYDRFLAKCRPDCVKVGLSYFEPVSKISDASVHMTSLSTIASRQTRPFLFSETQKKAELSTFSLTLVLVT